MQNTWILGLYIPERSKQANEVQYLLTKFGCSIKTRLGLHDINENEGSGNGIILLELNGDVKEFRKLESELKKLEGLIVKKMIFKPA